MQGFLIIVNNNISSEKLVYYILVNEIRTKYIIPIFFCNPQTIHLSEEHYILGCVNVLDEGIWIGVSSLLRLLLSKHLWKGVKTISSTELALG